MLAGLSLLLAGILGFIADSGFNTGDPLNGHNLIIFEVNGWHNLVHILSGLVLLAAAPKRASAKTVAIAFGVVYGIVTIIGLVNGNDVLGLFPVNPADNVLHIALTLLGLYCGFTSRGSDDVPADEPRTIGTKRFDRERESGTVESATR
jgi:hypothetical protein